MNDISNTIVIQASDNVDLTAICSQIESNNPSILNANVIINLNFYTDLNNKNLKIFLPIFKNFKKNNKSIVLVCEHVDFNIISDKFPIVPTLQEAYDVIEMEAIERDLGI
ncbi:ribonuclease Z [Flavobacterium branchiophilum]|uniref:Uncharacterized protein n=1 Tax=Flavobacterium branchiophilum TaxID=55197 RepID=A0A543G7L8_9FLAO|nr:ribonuclease Z [Flavobacterium branchiophilum]TQM42077.1 hypothetical protein BC670_3104 [Flavobacterium branchiophilum]GEM53848.1 hypothetical protein FB1_00690 [Flavobacterium branchiophilum NBRC 15030 = ATCC 35035]